MTEGVAIALIGGGVSLVIAILVPYINYRKRNRRKWPPKEKANVSSG